MLEHVKNPHNAMKEIYRILKNNGQAIILVPILLSIEESIENPEYNTEDLRWKYYGQNDHLRIFSKAGFISLLKSVLFDVKELDINFFGKEVFASCGLTKTSVLYLCKKNE